MHYKDLYKKIEASLAALEVSKDESELIRKVLEVVMREYGVHLGIRSGRLYMRDKDVYHLIHQIGESQDTTGKTLPVEYLPIRRLREDKYIIMYRRDEGVDANMEKFLVVDTFAAISLGANDQYLVSFSVEEPVDEMQLHYSLNTIRFATNFKMRELSLQDEYLKAREIQMSLLPSFCADRKGFDIFGKSVPATLVGGDAFDYIPISDDTLGIGVLDAVGHGLPAALQARDVITGLRMGMAGNIKIESMMVRLNQVIHRSNLTSRFASLFYGELEEYGHLVYINAGHPPPIFISRNDIYELRRGGMVLGPNPQAKYKRGFVYFHHGDLLVIFSDGVVEARNLEGTQFGNQKLRELVFMNRYLSSEEIVELIFEEVRSHTGMDAQQDDQTVVIIKRIGIHDVQF